ncbi:ATP-binding protein [Bacillus smithii]|uniref:ATP-binding protein n=1 Tax=Bacillus smithii TaxID=1479 RepID=UPI003D1FB7FC
MSRKIGKIIEVTSYKIVCEITRDPIPFISKGDIYDFNGVGSLISIYDKFQSYISIYQVTKVYEKEQILIKNENSKIKNIVIFDAVPLAQITTNKVDFGVRKFPMVGEFVYISTNEEIEKSLSSKMDGLIIGTINSNVKLLPRLDKDKLFSGHLSIFGNTNSGKSTTIKKILKEKIKIDSDFKAIIFDVHNEYDLDNVEQVSIDQISINPTYLSIEDWINLVNPSSLTQLPILINGIKIAHHLTNGISEDLAAYISYSAYYSNVEASTKLVFVRKYARMVNNKYVNEALVKFTLSYGKFDEAEKLLYGLSERFLELTGRDIGNAEEYIVEKYLEHDSSEVKLENIKDGINIALTLEESKGNLQVRSHCQTMITRLDFLLSEYKSFFVEDQEKRSNFEKIFTDKKSKIIKVNELSDSKLKFITHLILRVGFQKQRYNGELSQINFIFDEAHKYIKKEQFTESLVMDIFETIAREGRKFGVFICIISQQPHELSSTVVSQCSNFILHRLKNNLDLDFIKKSNPFITDIQISRLSSLPTGTALILGDAIPVPLEIEIDNKGI